MGQKKEGKNAKRKRANETKAAAAAEAGFSLKTDTNRLFTSDSKVVICSFFGRRSLIVMTETWLRSFFYLSVKWFTGSWFPNCFRGFAVLALLPVGTPANSVFEAFPVDCHKQRVHPIFPSLSLLSALRQINAGSTSSGFGGRSLPARLPAKSFC